MFDRDVLRELAVTEPGQPVLSVCARTDPRDPANNAQTPAWTIAAHNGLGAIAKRLETDGERADRLAFRTLRDQVAVELRELGPGDRGRSFAWFVGADGTTVERLTLQLPIRGDAVVWDDRPYVSPLVDVADRGAAVGVLVVDSETVQLVQVEQGEGSVPADAIYELGSGDWRPYGGSAGGSSDRGVRTTSHQERYDARVDEQRRRLFAEAATATAKRLDELGWERVIVAAQGQVAKSFGDALPRPLAERVAANVDLRLAGDDPSSIADAAEAVIEELWLADVTRAIDLAHERAHAGGAATLGVEETFGALVTGRVDHLVLDPDQDFAGSALPAGIGGPPALLGERAVESAIAADGRVSAVSTHASQRLAEAGGMAALLRY